MMMTDLNTLSIMAAVLYAQGGLDEPTAVQVAYSLAERTASHYDAARKAARKAAEADAAAFAATLRAEAEVQS